MNPPRKSKAPKDSNPNMALAPLSKAERTLASAESLPEIKKIIDIAEAARVYCRSAKLGEAAARHAEQIKLQAQRKAGEFLQGLEKSRGGRPAKRREGS